MKFLSSCHGVIFFLSYRQEYFCTNKSVKARNDVIEFSLVRIWKIRHPSPRCSLVWTLREVFFPLIHSILYNNYSYFRWELKYDGTTDYYACASMLVKSFQVLHLFGWPVWGRDNLLVTSPWLPWELETAWCGHITRLFISLRPTSLHAKRAAREPLVLRVRVAQRNTVLNFFIFVFVFVLFCFVLFLFCFLFFVFPALISRMLAYNKCISTLFILTLRKIWPGYL